MGPGSRIRIPNRRMRLSDNLSLKEVTKSATAIKHGISNEPSIEHLENLKAIAENIFQPIRNHFGVPIAVTSGYRSEELNKRIGGSLTSQHSKGEALDLDADVYGQVTNKEIFEYILDHIDFDQLIWEFGTDQDPDWVHVSYKRKERNRGEVLKAIRTNGKVRYEFY
jgi:zinc D-Ala-D-Ala carboxypeptidase